MSCAKEVQQSRYTAIAFSVQLQRLCMTTAFISSKLQLLRPDEGSPTHR